MAGSIRGRGHDVAIFTFFKGELAETIERQGIPVYDARAAKAIADLGPDIVQTNHLSCAHYLRATIPDAIRVHVMLGVIPPLEAPPLDASAFSLGLAVSEEVVARINRTPFGRDVPVVIFRNWFDDEAMAAPPARPADDVLRVAVVSNHAAEELVGVLAQLEASGGVKVDYFGAPKNSVPIDGAFLVRYDLIISIGRTPLLAAACGVPCILADIHGSDGLLTADNLDLVRTANFSGRYFRHRITVEHLESEIGKLSAFDRERLRSRIVDEYSLNTRVEWLMRRYEALLAARSDRAPAASGTAEAQLPPGEGFAFAEMAGMVLDLREQQAAERRMAAAAAADACALRFDRVSDARVKDDPYPHVVVKGALDRLDELNADFPSKDRFGPTIRMDGDLTSGDPGYEELIGQSPAYGALHRQVYSPEFVNAFLELFRAPIECACENKELLADPFKLKIISEPVERRISGQSFVGSGEPFLYARFDVGYGAAGYGVHNGGRGIHVDNLPRLISILIFLNTPRSMVGGIHRLYGLCRNQPVLRKEYRPVSGLLIASLQSNRAFHDVEPITAIDGERRAFYMAVSCSIPIWRKETHRELSVLSKNRFDPAPGWDIGGKLRRLVAFSR